MMSKGSTKKPIFNLKIRLMIYSYLNLNECLHKISLLSWGERENIVDSEIVSENKNHTLKIVGSKNANRKLFGEATRLKFVLRLISSLTIECDQMPINFGVKLASFISDLPDRFDNEKILLKINENGISKFDL